MRKRRYEIEMRYQVRLAILVYNSLLCCVSAADSFAGYAPSGFATQLYRRQRHTDEIGGRRAERLTELKISVSTCTRGIGG